MNWNGIRVSRSEDTHIDFFGEGTEAVMGRAQRFVLPENSDTTFFRTRSVQADYYSIRGGKDVYS